MNFFSDVHVWSPSPSFKRSAYMKKMRQLATVPSLGWSCFHWLNVSTWPFSQRNTPSTKRSVAPVHTGPLQKPKVSIVLVWVYNVSKSQCSCLHNSLCYCMIATKGARDPKPYFQVMISIVDYHSYYSVPVNYFSTLTYKKSKLFSAVMTSLLWMVRRRAPFAAHSWLASSHVIRFLCLAYW